MILSRKFIYFVKNSEGFDAYFGVDFELHFPPPPPFFQFYFAQNVGGKKEKEKGGQNIPQRNMLRDCCNAIEAGAPTMKNGSG